MSCDMQSNAKYEFHGFFISMKLRASHSDIAICTVINYEDRQKEISYVRNGNTNHLIQLIMTDITATRYHLPFCRHKIHLQSIPDRLIFERKNILIDLHYYTLFVNFPIVIFLHWIGSCFRSHSKMVNCLQCEFCVGFADHPFLVVLRRLKTMIKYEM